MYVAVSAFDWDLFSGIRTYTVIDTSDLNNITTVT